MSALPNPLHTTQKKAPARATKPAKLNQYGRDPLSPSERMRASSAYEKETGYAPFYHAFLSDLPRLSSGNSCTLLMLTLWAKSAGRGAPKKGAARPEWTLSLSVEDLAQICRCDVRTIERELVALEKRGLGEVKRPAKGQIEARLKYRDWEALPDYKTDVVEIPAPEETADPEQVDESKPGNQRVTGKKAIRLPAGALSRVFPVSCGVKQFRYKADGPVDLDITAVIQAGELIVTSRLPEAWAQKLANLKSSSNVSNDLISPARHGCREEEAKVWRKSPGVDHPRAGELCELFDPFFSKQAVGLLVMDESSLRKACESVQDVEHDYLVKFVVQRAATPIKSSKHVPQILADCYQSWKTSKVLSAAGLPVPSARKKGFVDGVKEAAARRLQKYGRI